MRIKSLVAVFITGLTLAVTGCGGVEEQPAPVAAPAGEQASMPVQEMAGCPLKWTCDTGVYYSTQAQCKSACGSGTTTCYRDYACTGGCICP